MKENIDSDVVAGFGDEWSRFDQTGMSADELQMHFESYFGIFPWGDLPTGAIGFDLGCGSGRWAKLVAPRVGKLHLIDPSDAIDIARNNLAEFENCEFHRASVDAIPLPDDHCDFGYCLGVLHHIPDTEAGLRSAVSKLKSGAPFLLYLYYQFDERPWWFRFIWAMTDLMRRLICRLPHSVRYMVSQILAALVYWLLARIALYLERLGLNVKNIPLGQYRNSSFYRMRTDALERFGTRIEKRFTKDEIIKMMKNCGLNKIKFSEDSFWTAVAVKG